MSSLLEIFQEKAQFTDEDLMRVVGYWDMQRSLKRNEVLISPGQQEQYLYYVVKGSLRLYWEKDGEEICFNFGYPDTFIAAYPSFVKNKPSDHFIRAITDCELIGIHKDNFNLIVETMPSVERAWRIFTEEALLERMEREMQMLMFSPEERFSFCMQRYPQLFQHIPQKYIASYIGMKPETLSRMKRAYAEKEMKR